MDPSFSSVSKDLVRGRLVAGRIWSGTRHAGGDQTTSPWRSSGGWGRADARRWDPAEGCGRSRWVPAEGCGRSWSVPAEGCGRSRSVPAEGCGRSWSVPAEGCGRSRSVPAEGSGRSWSVPAEGSRTLVVGTGRGLADARGRYRPRAPDARGRYRPRAPDARGRYRPRAPDTHASDPAGWPARRGCDPSGRTFPPARSTGYPTAPSSGDVPIGWCGAVPPRGRGRGRDLRRCADLGRARATGRRVGCSVDGSIAASSHRGRHRSGCQRPFADGGRCAPQRDRAVRRRRRAGAGTARYRRRDGSRRERGRRSSHADRAAGRRLSRPDGRRQLVDRRQVALRRQLVADHWKGERHRDGNARRDLPARLWESDARC